VEAVLQGTACGRGDLPGRLAELLGVEPALQAVESQTHQRVNELASALSREQELLAQHVDLLVRSAKVICATPELRLALVSERALVSMAYEPQVWLPLGALVEGWRWGEVSFQRGRDRLFVVGAGGSPLSGAGSMWGVVAARGTWDTAAFDLSFVRRLQTHPLVRPFQERVRRGSFLRFGDVVARLQWSAN